MLGGLKRHRQQLNSQRKDSGLVLSNGKKIPIQTQYGVVYFDQIIYAHIPKRSRAISNQALQCSLEKYLGEYVVSAINPPEEVLWYPLGTNQLEIGVFLKIHFVDKSRGLAKIDRNVLDVICIPAKYEN